jgi:hypothetical protein
MDGPYQRPVDRDDDCAIGATRQVDMSPYLKSAGMVAFVAVLLSIAQIWSGFQGIAATGSGGLGAVSFGISEFFVEFAVLTVAVWAVIYWRSKRV